MSGGTRKIKVPKDGRENRILKEGLQEDDNEDIAYLNFRLIWPVCGISFVSIFFIVLAICTMEMLPHLENETKDANIIVAHYGLRALLCNNTIPYEKGMYPSILRQIEMKVTVNVLFRIAICVPMAARIFLALVIRNSYLEDHLSSIHSPFLWFCNELCTVVSTIDVLSLALFAVVTIRFDYPEVYKYSFCTFIVMTIVHMYLRTMLSFTKRDNEIRLFDKISMSFKCISTMIFSWTASQIFYFHQNYVYNVICHGYVTPWNAIHEYLLIIAYLLFNLTLIVDIRDIRFVCYPRTSSGECEPLRPSNFDKADGKFAHCRAYELRQRQLTSIN